MKGRWFVVSITIAALCVAWLALRRPSTGTPTLPLAAVDRAINSAWMQVELVEPTPKGKGAESSGGTRVIAQSVEVMVPVMGEADDEPADGAWLDGIVEFPPGTPADERAFVSMVVPAINHNFRSTQPVRFPVEGDGSFRVTYPSDAWNLELDVVGRFVHTPDPLRVELNAEKSRIVLRPELGACVRVQVLPSEALVQRGIDSNRVTLGRRRHAEGLAFDPRSETVGTDEHGVGDVGGLDVNDSWSITAFTPGSVLATHAVHGLRPGELREIEIALDAGPRFRGIVRDVRGAPIRGARVLLAVGAHGFHGVSATTGEDGSFLANGSQIGATRMRVTCSGYEDFELGPWDTVAGADIAGLDIVLPGGEEITGIVRWPAGSIVSSAELSVRRDSRDSRNRPERVPVRADGTFRVLAVANEPCTLSVRVRARVDPSDPKSRYGDWIASVPVSAPISGIVLAPSLGSALRGRVVDDLGLGVPDAEVWVIAAGGFGSNSRPQCRTDADGSFTLPQVTDGSWTLCAGARDHAFARPLDVEMPAARPVELVVLRTGTIEGRALDARGGPVGGADIEIAPADEANAWRKYFPSAKTSSDGSFRIERVPIGTSTVRARHAAHARSLAARITTTAGETTSGIELVMRDGGTIDARVLDVDGSPIASQEVALRRADMDWNVPLARALTDEHGFVRFEHVDPGPVLVMSALARGRKWIEPASVVVADGQTTSVVLQH